MYVDERNVPHDSQDSTHKAVKEALLSKVAIPPENVIAITEGAPVEQVCAAVPASNASEAQQRGLVDCPASHVSLGICLSLVLS